MLSSARSPPSQSCQVLLIWPQFLVGSFWNYRTTCEMFGARYPAAPLALITVAALLPDHWNVRLIDCNVETLDVSDIDSADLVMTGGMMVQQPDILRLIDLCHVRGKPVVVGGPDVTSSPQVYEKADFQVLGEAESVMPAFVDAWEAGQRHGVFEAEKFTTDVTRSPIPRFDLLNFKHYLYVGVQFSRGCPFNCEFCDIIELYGRVPRAKTTPQMLAELDRLYELGYRGHVDFVDDNLIGNKKALKLFLPHLIEWQKARDFPFEFSTEASINLADDDQLLAMLKEVNFFIVFVGIESPDTDTLVHTQKKQNTRRSLEASIHKIYDAGIFVLAGFIVGFDTDKPTVADGMVECIEATSIPVCMVGLLYAIPNTQLTRRLAGEGRLHAGHDIAAMKLGGDHCTAGLNFETVRPRRALLEDYVSILRRIYHPSAYFARVRHVARLLRRPVRGDGTIHWRALATDLARLAGFLWYMSIRNPAYLHHIVRTIADCGRHNPTALPAAVAMMALYMHLGPFSRHVISLIEQHIADIDAGRWVAPALVPTGASSAPKPAPHRAPGEFTSIAS